MKKNTKGFSLIEILIVLVILPVIAIISTQSLINVLSGQKKVESETQARRGIEQIFSYMQRNIFNAQNVTCPDTNNIIFQKDVSVSGKFSCTTNATSGGTMLFYEDITGGSVQINDDAVNVNKCIIQCIIPPPGSTSQPGVAVTIGVNIDGVESNEGGSLELTRRFYTRSY